MLQNVPSRMRTGDRLAGRRTRSRGAESGARLRPGRPVARHLLEGKRPAAKYPGPFQQKVFHWMPPKKGLLSYPVSADLAAGAGTKSENSILDTGQNWNRPANSVS